MSIRLGIDMRAKNERDLVCVRVETAQGLDDSFPPLIIGIPFIEDAPAMSSRDVSWIKGGSTGGMSRRKESWEDRAEKLA